MGLPLVRCACTITPVEAVDRSVPSLAAGHPCQLAVGPAPGGAAVGARVVLALYDLDTCRMVGAVEGGGVGAEGGGGLAGGAAGGRDGDGGQRGIGGMRGQEWRSWRWGRLSEGLFAAFCPLGINSVRAFSKFRISHVCMHWCGTVGVSNPYI